MSSPKNNGGGGGKKSGGDGRKLQGDKRKGEASDTGSDATPTPTPIPTTINTTTTTTTQSSSSSAGSDVQSKKKLKKEDGTGLAMSGLAEMEQPASGDASSFSSSAALGIAASIDVKTSLSIVHIDVAQGESTLIVYRRGTKLVYSAIIDGGKALYVDNVENTLKAYGVKKLNALISTHYDADHIEGLTVLLEDASYIKRSCTKVFHRGLPKNKSNDEKIQKFQNAAGKMLTEPSDCKRVLYQEDDFKFHCLYYHRSPTIGNGENSENDAGLMLEIDFGNFRYYTAGDLGHAIEKEHAPENCVAFKCGHHGSRNSTSVGLLDRLKPAIAIISAGKHSYCHPDESVLRILQESEHVKDIFLTNCAYNRPQVNHDYLNRERGLAKEYLIKIQNIPKMACEKEQLESLLENLKGEDYSAYLETIVKICIPRPEQKDSGVKKRFFKHWNALRQGAVLMVEAAAGNTPEVAVAE
ncbi:hypothetical protein HSX11_19410, partial [Oxalobacteraceae bacterium]|nr:hypothetical protein [Oxalobacteraceae bacterium]